MQKRPIVEQPASTPQLSIDRQQSTSHQPPIYQPPLYPPQMYPPPTYQPPQQPVPPPKKKMSTGMKWLILAVVILALTTIGGIILAVSMAHPTQTQQVTSSPTQKPATMVPTPQATPTLSQEDRTKAAAKTMTITELVQSGDSSKGAIVHFRGIVVGTVTTSDGTPMAMITDPSNGAMQAVVGFPKEGTDLSKIANGDTIEIWGEALGMIQGGDPSNPGIAALYFTDYTSGYAR